MGNMTTHAHDMTILFINASAMSVITTLPFEDESLHPITLLHLNVRLARVPPVTRLSECFVLSVDRLNQRHGVSDLTNCGLCNLNLVSACPVGRIVEFESRAF